MDLQDKSAALEYQVAQSNIRLFGTSSKVFTAGDPQDNEEDTIPVTMMTVSVPRITTTLKMTLMTMTLKTVRKRHDVQTYPKPLRRHGRRRINTQVESESLRTCFKFFISTAERLDNTDWTSSTSYSSSLSPEEILHGKGKMRTGTSKWLVTTTFSRIVWSAAVPDSRKDHIDPEGLKDGRTTKC